MRNDDRLSLARHGAAAHQRAAPHQRAAAHRRRSQKRWGVSLAVVGAVLLGVTLWVGIRGYLAYQELTQFKTLAGSLEAAVTAGDSAQGLLLTDDLRTHASAAASLTTDPVWRFAEVVPYLGPNLAAVRTISEASSTLATDAVQPLFTVAQTVTINDVTPIDGRIPTDALESASETLQPAARAAQAASTQVGGLDSSQLLPPLASAVDSATMVLDRLSDRVTTMSNVASLLPAMVGASEPRNYLVVVQNNAEVRATGGIPGALVLLHADRGVISLTQQASTADFPEFSEPVIDLPTGTVNVFGPNPAKILQDTTMTPNFAVTARAVSAMWSQTFGGTVDGVLSLDPVTLSYLLAATGPVSLPTGEVLTEGNATEYLLSTVYTSYSDPRDQNGFFAAAASAVFERVSSGAVDASAFLTALERAGKENRVFVWNAREDEQALLSGTTLASIVPSKKPGAFGVFLNDQSAAKMDYYLDTQVSIGTVGCRSDEKPTYGVRVTLTNTAPADAAQSLPRYVTGDGVFGTPPGNIRTSVVVYGASSREGTWGEVLAGEARQDSFVSTDGDHSVVQTAVELAPGETSTLTFRYLGLRESLAEPSLIISPLLTTNPTGRLELTCKDALK